MNDDRTLAAIRDCLVEAGDALGEMSPAIAAGEIFARARRRRTHRRLVTAGVTSVIAVAGAGAVAAAQLAGSASPAAAGPGRARTVLTTAMVHQVASASRIALAHSGHAVISYRDTLGGRLESSGTEDITFSGRNWNLLLRFPPGQESAERFVVNRVVNGQAYDYFIANHGLRWYHLTGPDAVSSLKIPDPRVLLRELDPAGRFVPAGRTVAGGAQLERLRARYPRQLPVLNLPGVWPGAHLTALTVWVDGHGVVRRMSMTASQTTITAGTFLRHTDRHRAPGQRWAISGKKLKQTRTSLLTVTFRDIGEPQIITAPAHAINVYARG